MSHNITVEGGTSVRLPTAGKYCDRDIVITARGSAAEVTLQSKTVTPSKSTQEVKADAGYTGLDKVTVSPIPGEYIIPSGTKTITENGTHDATAYASVSVNVPSKTPVLQEKTVTPTTDAQAVTADSGYDGLSKVTVNAMPTADQALPTITVDNSGLVLATAKQQSGYVVAGTRTGMKQLPTQVGKTVTPSKSEQTVVESGRYTTGAVMVAAIPDSYIQPSGSLDISTNGTHDVTNYASVNVNVAGGGGGGGGDSDLPSGCRRVDYILFTGDQTVDTGIICNQNTKIQLAFTRERSTQHYMFGVASSDNKASVTAYMGGSWRFGNKSVSKVPTTNADMIYSGLVDNSTVTITGSASAISSVSDFETVGSLLLGACRNSNGTLGASQFEGKIFFFSMWEGDEQVLKLVPVVDADGNFNFYDTISKQLFGSITDIPLDGGNI